MYLVIFQIILSFGQYCRYPTYLKSGQTCCFPQHTVKVVLCALLPGLSVQEACHQSGAVVSTAQPSSAAFQTVAGDFMGSSCQDTECLCGAPREGLGTIKSKLMIQIVILFSYSYVYFPSFYLCTFLLPVQLSVDEFFIPLVF